MRSVQEIDDHRSDLDLRADLDLMMRNRRGSTSSSRDNTSKEEISDDEASRTALSAFRAKEEQIEKKKMEVREKVFAQLGGGVGVEEETKRLAIIQKELETMADPTRKEVSAIRKKIDAVNRELKLLGHNCLKKEYKEALEAFNGKSREKAQLMGRAK
ncbi:hypothetical protein Cni_G16234 [Canna indica]|uniref:RAB6-interacting golgin n=1 Tax=Canna indica TaxID=4628 RepID=A0AAQ3KFX3_9LILI|nr:hypothetical protein Cni_G16234 [Canna indica]